MAGEKGPSQEGFWKRYSRAIRTKRFAALEMAVGVGLEFVPFIATQVLGSYLIADGVKRLSTRTQTFGKNLAEEEKGTGIIRMISRNIYHNDYELESVVYGDTGKVITYRARSNGDRQDVPVALD